MFNNSLDPWLDNYSEVISNNSEANKAMYPDPLNFADWKYSIIYNFAQEIIQLCFLPENDTSLFI